MDIAQILGQLQSGQLAGADGKLGMDDLIGMIAGQTGVAPQQVNDVLGHLGGQVQAGVTDSGALAQSAAQATGLDMNSIMQMLQGLMASGQAGQAGGLMEMATQLLDQDKDGSIIDDVMGMAGNLLGRK
jgi:hypothetical protein